MQISFKFGDLMKKVVLITGASAGIGKETAKIFLKSNYKVYVAARRVEKMQDLVDLGAIAVKMDITKEDEIKNLINIISESEKRLDILVNNAGFGSYGAMEDTSIEDAKYQFDVNLFGLARLTQLCLPIMREQRSGMIFNISSMGGQVYTPMGSWYHATKYALEGWSDCLRLELDQFGIKVVIIEPGVIKSEFGDVMLGPLMERSGNSVYKNLAQKLKDSTLKVYDSSIASSPIVIAEKILKVSKKKNPSARYPVGGMARPIILFRRLVGDRIYDMILKLSF